ncbi:MAG: OmpA family protein [Sandaracinaceae bacterium]
MTRRVSTMLALFAASTVSLALPRPAAAIPGASRASTTADCARLLVSVPLVFDVYQGRVSQTELRLMDAIAERLRACPDQSFELQVHTDTVRMSSFNLRQSQAVADHVRALLVERGVPAAQLAPCGWGEERPGPSDPSWEPGSPNNRLVIRSIEGAASDFVCHPTPAP